MSQETDLLDRITVRPDVFGGKPIIRDMRIAVEHILANLAAGGTVEDILSPLPSPHFSSTTRPWTQTFRMSSRPAL